MDKAGLFGGGWEDYLDALNTALDKHPAANWPPSPFGASVGAILTGMPDDGDVSPTLPSGTAVGAGAAVQRPTLNFATNPEASRAFQGSPARVTPVQFSASEKPHQVSGMDAGRLGQTFGLQFPRSDRDSSGDDSTAFLTQLDSGILASRPSPDGPLQTASLDPNSGAAGSAQTTNGGLGAAIGYSETGSGAYRAKNDEVIRKAVADYNSRNGYREGNAGYISPELMKAWQMQESGGSKDQAAFESDPFQVNKPKDWFDDKAKIMGLTKGQVMTPQISAEAALKWLQYKSWVHDNSGKPTTYKGVRQGFDSYNGGGVKNYGKDILSRYNQSWGKH